MPLRRRDSCLPAQVTPLYAAAIDADAAARQRRYAASDATLRVTIRWLSDITLRVAYVTREILRCARCCAIRPRAQVRDYSGARRALMLR